MLCLPNETERYVFRIIALKEVISNPKKYGFILEKTIFIHLPKTRIIKVDTAFQTLLPLLKNSELHIKNSKFTILG